MLGPIVIIVTLLVVIPVAVCITGAIVAWALGSLLKTDAEATHAGTEYIDLGR